MTSTQIRCFLALARHLNFTSAAAELQISQSTLSMHISALEKNIGQDLFIRDRKSVVLSPAGELIKPVLEDSCLKMEEAMRSIDDLAREGDNLKVGQLAGMRLNNRLTEIIKVMQDENPDLKVSLTGMTNDEMLESLRNNTVEVAVLMERMYADNEDFISTLFFQSQVSVIYPSGYGRSFSNWSVKDLNDETFVVIAPGKDAYDKQYLDDLSDKFGFEPGKILYARSVEDKLICVKMGRGVCISDHTSRAYYNDEYVFFDLPDEYTRCMVISLARNKNPNVHRLHSLIKASDRNADRQ